MDTLIAHDHLVFNYKLARVSDPDGRAARSDPPVVAGHVAGTAAHLPRLLRSRRGARGVDRARRAVTWCPITDPHGDDRGVDGRPAGLGGRSRVRAPAPADRTRRAHNPLVGLRRPQRRPCAEIWLGEPVADDAYSGSRSLARRVPAIYRRLHRQIAAGAVWWSVARCTAPELSRAGGSPGAQHAAPP